jgi:hypothetical protein
MQPAGAANPFNNCSYLATDTYALPLPSSLPTPFLDGARH